MMDLPSGTFPFPFFGAGEATYFEWAEVHVRFARPPTEAEREAIAARVPPPLRDSIDWDGAQLMVASDQMAHMHIAETYLDTGEEGEQETADDQEDEDDDEDFDDEGRFFFAESSQVHAFNQDTQDWLIFTHAACPVLCAFRHEDGESGGTELSPWHAWSVQQLPRLLPELAPLASPSSDSHTAFMTRGVLEMGREAGVELPETVLDWLEPGRREVAALRKGDGAELVRLLGRAELSAQDLEALARASDGTKPEQAAPLLAASRTLLGRDDLPAALLEELTVAAALSRTEDPAEAGEVLEAARRRVAQDRQLTDRLGYRAYRLARDVRFLESLALFDVVVDGNGEDLSSYCNALWAVMADNNHLPVQPERARHYLETCLAHGPRNPAIFYNAACVWWELGDREQVLHNLKQAREHGYPKPQLMRDEPLFAPLASDPRFREIFADLDEEEAPAPKKKAAPKEKAPPRKKTKPAAKKKPSPKPAKKAKAAPKKKAKPAAKKKPSPKPKKKAKPAKPAAKKKPARRR
jgi:hypothetical protein